MHDLVEFVAKYAQDHYNDGGWDVIVECWSDEEIRQFLDDEGIQTKWGAIAAFLPIVNVWADRQAEARYQGQD